jgi:hypothetical protein
MRSTIIRWTIYCFGLFAAGPAAGLLISMIRAADGGPGTPIVSGSPFFGLALALAALAIALAVGVMAGRLLGPAAALTASGIVVAWAAWRSAEVHNLIRTYQSGSPLIKLALEGAIIGLLGLGLAITCIRAGHSSPGSSGRIPWLPKPGPGTWISMAVGLAAGAVAAWLIAASPLKGQSVFAAIAAGTMAAAAARLVDIEAPIHFMFIPIAALAILAPVTGLLFSGDVVAASYKGTLFPLASISPLDWIAGGLLGIPLGVSWAGSMIEKRLPDDATAGTPAAARVK